MTSDFKKLLGYDNKKKFTQGKSGLDLLKEHFGHSVPTDETEVGNRERVHEKLHDKFNFDDVGNITTLNEQHQKQLDEKQKIIEELEVETSELANEVLALEKEKAIILDELNTAKWMENKVALSTKNMYEDKIRKIVDDFRINHVDDSKIIPLLTAVSRKKQGNQKLNYGDWLRIPENRYLEQINQNIAKNIFEDTNALIDRAMGRINRVRTYAGDEPTTTEWSLTESIEFSGDTNPAVATENYVSTTFDPQVHNLHNGFTVSYWVKPLEIPDPASSIENLRDATVLLALGRKFNNNQRFTFGLQNASNAYIGVGDTKFINTAHGMSTDTWYHWVITFEGGTDGELKVYRDTTEILDDTTSWTQTTGDTPIYFGARNLQGTGYNNGWNCRLTDVSIFNEPKDQNWVTTTYNNGVPTDLTKESNLVGYWIFENSEAKDLSGNGNHGTLTETGNTLGTGAVEFKDDVPEG